MKKAAEEEPDSNKDNDETEAIWANTNSSPSLSQIALSKPKVNFGLLEMHLQLVTVLYMAVSFDLNTSSMVMNLFDKTVKSSIYFYVHMNQRNFVSRANLRFSTSCKQTLDSLATIQAQS